MPNKKKAMRGSLNRSTPGAKPAVAFRLQKEAEVKLREKLKFLEVAIDKQRASQDHLPSLALPNSRRAFLAWQPVGPDGAALSKSSNDTLKKHEEVLASVDDAVAAVKLLQNATKVGSVSKADRLASSRRSQKIHLAVRQIAERALVSSRKEVTKLRDEVTAMKAKLMSAENEFQMNFEKISAECQDLRAENARLAKVLAKAIPLKALQ